MKRLSIIIVTYHSESDIYDCLDSVWKHSDLPREELEVIIVDNSPESDAMFGKLRALYGDDVILLHNSRNGGYGQGNNLGIRQATAPVLLIMNPDVRLTEPVFKTAVEAFERDSDLCFYGMKQMFDEQTPSPYSFACTSMMNGYAYTLLTAFGNRFDYYSPSRMHFSGSCFFVDREKFIDIGLFDESVFMYCEEDDISYRMRQRFGVHSRYNKHLHYVHPMHLREPDLDYEKQLVDIAILQNEKKGYPRQKTIRGRLQNVNCLIWMARLKKMQGKGSPEYLEFLRKRRDYLRSLKS